MTTTTPSMHAVPDHTDMVGLKGVSEAARAATLAYNLAGAARLEAAQRMVLEFALLEEASEEGAEEGAVEGRKAKRPAYARLDPTSRARDHLVAACQLTVWHAGRMVTAAEQIHTRLSHLCAAVSRGLMPEQMAIDTACRLAEVPDSIIEIVEREVVASLVDDLEGGDRTSRTALDELVEQSVAKHDKKTAEDAAAAAAKERKIRFKRSRNGMASLWASLPAEDAELLRRRIQAEADLAAANGDERTMDQLRADVLTSFAVYQPTQSGAAGSAAASGPASDGPASAGSNFAGSTSSGPQAGGAAGDAADATSDDATDDDIELGEVGVDPDMPRPTLGNAAAGGESIKISVIAAAAQGLPNRVEFVRGSYSSYEWLCRELLESEDAKVRFEIIDPAPGALDDPDRALKYVIPAKLAERIRLRDGTCRHPGCQVDASKCDVDHVIAFNKDNPEEGGPTYEWNLACLCRKHHREKTFGKCTYRTGPLGELIIVTESGHRHRTRPKGPLARARDGIRKAPRIWHDPRQITMCEHGAYNLPA